MIWLTWRQYRIPLVIGLVAFAVTAILLLILGHSMYNDIQALQAPQCADYSSCDAIRGDLSNQYFSLHNVAAYLIAMPTIIGIFIGVPLVSSEFEQRTYQMIWTQGISRRRWLGLHLLALFAAVLLTTGITAWLVSWCENTNFLLTLPAMNQTNERFSVWGYDLSGTVPVAYAAFGLALGLACGALFHRTLPAIAVTIAGFLATRFAVEALWRPHFLPPLTKIYPLYPFPTENQSITSSRFDWWLEQGGVQNGHFTKYGIVVPSDCVVNMTPSSAPDAMEQCMQAHGIANYVIYQPYERFWLFQGIETALFALAAAGLVWLTFAVVLRRP